MILVTGCTGYLGFHICEHLKTKKISFFGIDNFSRSSEKNIIDKLRIEIDKGEYKGIVRRHDSIIYFGEITEHQLDAIIDFEYMGQYGWFRDYDIIKQYGSVMSENVITEKGKQLVEAEPKYSNF